VRRVVEQSKATAAARKPDTMTIIDSDSEQHQILPDEDAEITDGDKKLAAVDKTANKHRKEAAKVMASL
jgi:hypothetical protein